MLSAALVAGAVACGAWAVVAWAESVYGTPSCSWPVRIRGTATSDQEGLVRCYLLALASGDRSGMSAVATRTPPTRITSIDFRDSADARAGTATAIFIPNPVDSSAADVEVHFADGVVAHLDLVNEDAWGGPNLWRMQIGS